MFVVTRNQVDPGQVVFPTLEQLAQVEALRQRLEHSTAATAESILQEWLSVFLNRASRMGRSGMLSPEHWLQASSETYSTATAALQARLLENASLGAEAAIQLFQQGELSRLTFDFTGYNGAAEDFARSRAGELIQDLGENTRRFMARDVADWVASDEPLKALVKRLEQNYAFSPARARTIGITETTEAYYQGQVAAWTQHQDYMLGVQVLTANDERVCPICAPLGGLIFTEEGGAAPQAPTTQLAEGVRSQSMFSGFVHPGGTGAASVYRNQVFNHPPFHVGCRCGVAPVMKPLDQIFAELPMVRTLPGDTNVIRRRTLS